MKHKNFLSFQKLKHPRRHLLYFIYIIFTITSCENAREDFSMPPAAIVSTEYGKVRGYIHKGIYTYKGIPYAKAERFMPPEKPVPWKGIRNTMAYGPVCQQNGPNVIDQSEFFFHHDFGYAGEDCQRLNIWSPKVNDDGKRPVMVWLHGGGFATGSGNELPSYDGESLSKTGDVVVVTLNHRLNSLGFLNLSSFGEEYKHSANLGMLDIIAALHWVKENIAAFGGDPANITIFGQSGGGRKVCTLLTMPAAKGLFQKAVIESGASLQFYNEDESVQIGKLVVKELGLDSLNIDSIRHIPCEILRRAGDSALKKLNDQYQLAGKNIDGFQARWGPAIDGNTIPWQPADPAALLLMKDIPVIIGSTKHEFVPAFNTPDFIKPKSEKEAAAILGKKYGRNAESIIREIKLAYPEDKRPLDLLDIDSRGRLSTLQWANLRSGKGKVYNYLFTWESPVLEGRFRSCHCLELPFVFNNIMRCQEMTGGSMEALVLAGKMSQAWIQFARNGIPKQEGLPVWEPYTEKSGATMIFNNTCSMVHQHDKKLVEMLAYPKSK
jgi:para-nitrobenzyl esterase